MVSAIILAAGESKRMGEKNKLVLPFGKKTIFEETFSNVRQSIVDEIVIVVGHEPKKIKSLISDKTATVVYNSEYRTGLSSSMKRGISALTKDTDGYMICLADMPFLQTEDYNRLIRAFETSDSSKKIVIPVHNGRYGNPKIFSRHFKKEILTNEYPHGGKNIVKESTEFHIKVEMDEPNIFEDIDTTDQYDSLIN